MIVYTIQINYKPIAKLMMHRDDARRRFSALPKTTRTKMLERRPARAIIQNTAVSSGGARQDDKGVKACEVVAVETQALTSS